MMGYTKQNRQKDSINRHTMLRIYFIVARVTKRHNGFYGQNMDNGDKKNKTGDGSLS